MPDATYGVTWRPAGMRVCPGGQLRRTRKICLPARTTLSVAVAASPANPPPRRHQAALRDLSPSARADARFAATCRRRAERWGDCRCGAAIEPLRAHTRRGYAEYRPPGAGAAMLD